MNSRNSLHQALQQRVYGSVTPDLLFRRARGSKYLVQCLQRSGTLTGHDGCVNSISWSDSGDLLLSGSDDCRLNIYKPFQKKLLHTIRTGHRANIFSAKFLPCSSDKKVVSCSGDGMLHFTDVEKPESYGKCSYNCHSGTAYEVITTPGDPNTFISCGEDGTVRMFDLRTKSKCTKRDCKEDILIECGKAVTSIGVNPLAPYQLAIGCEDSIVALFDRRSLSTASSSSGSNAMKGMVYKFKPEALKDRTCRVTSLEYSADGRELLVSYCADYVYLFDVKGRKEIRLTPDSSQGNGLFPSNNSKKNVPLKRLRLRGDWSDTGPNARPDSEAASTESTLMQRMSDLFVRWIEESFRGSQRNRLRSVQSRASASSSTSVSSSASIPSRSTNSSSSDSSGIVEAASPLSPVHDGADESSDEMDESLCTSPSVVKMKTPSMTEDSPGQSTRESSNQDDSELTSLHTEIPGSSGLSVHEGKCKMSKESESVSHDTKHDSDCNQIDLHTSQQSNSSSIPSIEVLPHEQAEGAVSSRVENSNNETETVNKEGMAGTCEMGVASTRGEVSPGPDTSESNHDTSCDSPQSLAATRIQRMYRNYKAAKSTKSLDSWDYYIDGEWDEIWVPKMTRVYRGHRNARTMIKEARFWGDRYIVSGSDCGRIFVWDKNTTDIAMVLQGDRHVVNCVQPHPFDPILASSGIDYDIKLWAPTADEPSKVEGLEEIIKRNEQMLEESRDTITVPASFMLRMLASLNHARFGRTQDDSDTDSNDEF